MQKAKSNQKGSSVVVVLLALLLIAVIGFGGYYVWNTNRDKTPTANTTDKTSSPKSNTGGPAPNTVVSTKITYTTGQYLPKNVQVKKGDTVTWEMKQGGEVRAAVENDTNSTEKFSSQDLTKEGDTFSHTFNTVGTFNWHDKYDGNQTGIVTVTE